MFYDRTLRLNQMSKELTNLTRLEVSLLNPDVQRWTLERVLKDLRRVFKDLRG